MPPGCPRPTAAQLVTQLLVGSAALLAESGEHPAELRAEVTSPGGTTAAGLRALERAGVRAAFLECVLAATRAQPAARRQLSAAAATPAVPQLLS